MASTAKGIGEKYGSSLDSFAKDLQSGVDAVFLKWAEDSILIMSNIIGYTDKFSPSQKKY